MKGVLSQQIVEQLDYEILNEVAMKVTLRKSSLFKKVSFTRLNVFQTHGH